ncbi:MAG: nucleotidyltransferase domain-containing protein [Balneolales bacterium]
MESDRIVGIDLEQLHLDSICKVALIFSEIEKVILFGSRALETNRKGSDIDLALTGSKVTHSTVLRFHDILNQETLIPYQIDVVDFNTIWNRQLLDHIEKHGVIIYQK